MFLVYSHPTNLMVFVLVLETCPGCFSVSGNLSFLFCVLQNFCEIKTLHSTLIIYYCFWLDKVLMIYIRRHNSIAWFTSLCVTSILIKLLICYACCR